MNVKELFQGSNIDFSEAMHSNVCYVTYNNKGEKLHKPFHCKDFYNEMWYPYFNKTKACRSVYGFKLSDTIISSIGNITSIVLFKHDKDSLNMFQIDEIKELENRQKIGDYIINAVTMLLGNRYCIKKIRVYTDHVIVDVRTNVFKYPTINSLLMYIFRTSLDAGYYNNSNVLELTDFLIEKDPTYYAQHKKFKEILTDAVLLKNIKLLKWKMFYTYGCELHSSQALGDLHNNSGFISYWELIQNNKVVLRDKYLINNKIKIK